MENLVFSMFDARGSRHWRIPYHQKEVMCHSYFLWKKLGRELSNLRPMRVDKSQIIRTLWLACSSNRSGITVSIDDLVTTLQRSLTITDDHWRSVRNTSNLVLD